MPSRAKMTVVVIEDNSDLCEMLVEDLFAYGYDALGYLTVEDFRSNTITADIFILDVNLPGASGITFARDLRAVDKRVGIIILSARTGAESRTKGYQSGVDIYLQKPCSSSELLSAVERVAEKVSCIADTTEQPKQGYKLLSNSLTLVGPNEEVILTPREVSIIQALTNAPGHQLDYNESKLAYCCDTEVSNSAFEVGLGRLRKKIEKATGKKKSIIAIRGEGYRLILDVAVE